MSESSFNKDELLLQCENEYSHGLKYRQKREARWREVDDLYYGHKKKSLVTRANVHIPKMQGTIEALLSKIDDPPVITYEPQKESDKRKAEKVNGLLKFDMRVGDWEMKDILSKKDSALYGRAVYKKYATNEGGFKDYLDVVDCLNFVIDPLAGGLDPMNKAMYMGQDNIIKNVHMMIANAEKAGYDKEVLKEIGEKMQADSDVDNEYRSLQNRRSSLCLSEAVYLDDNSVRLIEWYTTYLGERYYCLFSPDFKKIVKAKKLKDIFKSDEFPFASWAVFPRLFEFWTPGFGEMLIEPNKIQNVILSQILDNNAFRNYGMKAYDANKVKNPNSLNPRPMGRIAVDGNPKDIVMDIGFPTLDNATGVYNLMEGIWDKETGINSQVKGTPNSKRMSATEFAGLIDEVDDRIFTTNKMYSACYKRVAKLYYYGVEENMTRERRVKVLGADGYTWEKISQRDVKGEYEVAISSGKQDETNNRLKQDRFLEFVKVNKENPRVNQQFLDEKSARIMGLTDDEVERLMNPNTEGDWKILAKAAEENEELLKNDVEPYRGATTGHVQRHLDYLQDNADIDDVVYARIQAHADSELEFVEQNMNKKADKLINQNNEQLALGGAIGAPGGEGGVIGEPPISPEGMPQEAQAQAQAVAPLP